MEFKYKPVHEYTETLEIDDVGQCALEITSNMIFDRTQMCSYLIIITVLGRTTVLECGPLSPGLNVIPKGFVYKITEDDYDSDKLKTIISVFLENKKNRVVESARKIDINEALNMCINPIEHMRQLNSFGGKG